MKRPTCSGDKCRAYMFDPEEQEISGNYINLYPGDSLARTDPPIFNIRPTTKPTLRAGKKHEKT